MRSWLLLPFLLVSAEAHRPGVAETEVTVDKPTVSWVLAGVFHEGDEVFTVVLPLDAPIALPFELMVPAQPRWQDHRPAFAIVGPGLPVPDEATRAFLPRDVPEGQGVFVERNDRRERLVYFEQVMRRTLWTSGSIAIPLSGATHEVWIWSPDGTTGDFQLGFGVEEDFSDGGFGALFKDFGRYAW